MPKSKFTTTQQYPKDGPLFGLFFILSSKITKFNSFSTNVSIYSPWKYYKASGETLVENGFIVSMG